MRGNLLILVGFCIFGLSNCSEEHNVELPLTQKNGYGYFYAGLGGVNNYSKDDDPFWKKMYLKVQGAPANWTDIKYGHIETNIHQAVYQNYILGNVSIEKYEELQKGWTWKPDTLALSKAPVKTKIAFVYGIDPAGQMKLILDANNNLDFSDDKNFIPVELSLNENKNRDSIALRNTMNVTYENFTDNKITNVTTPLFIAYVKEVNMLMVTFPQHSVANFQGETIAVCPDGFTSPSYGNSKIALINDEMKQGDKISYENLIAKNEFIEIKGVVYRNMGVNPNKKVLMLEKMNSPKNELISTQVGFKTFAFEGENFVTKSNIVSDELKGKYVLLDFWATWCRPCRKEIPNLKKLYEKTDRKNFEIIGVVGESTSDDLAKIIKNDSVTWPQILSTGSVKIISDYGINGYPVTFLLNPEGVIIAKGLTGKELEEKVLGLFKK